MIKLGRDNILERREQDCRARDDNGGTTDNIIGVAASGLDLAVDLLFRLYEGSVNTANQYQFQSVVWDETMPRFRNQSALDLLRDWMLEPDDLGDAWWEEFDRGLHHRLSFREFV